MHAIRLSAALGLAVALAPAPAGAQPACIAGTAADYFALGAQGCTLGGVTFAQFTPLIPPQNFDGGRLTLTPITRAVRDRVYVGFHLELSAPFALSSTAALATNRCVSPGSFCYADRDEYQILLSASGLPLGGFALANPVGSVSSSGTWLSAAGADITASRESDDGGQQPLGVIHGLVSNAGEDFGAQCRTRFANDNDFGGPDATATRFCPTNRVADPPNGYYSVSLRAYVQSYTFDTPPAGSATAELVSADVLFDVGRATTVPEPATAALLAPALLALGYATRRRRVPPS